MLRRWGLWLGIGITALLIGCAFTLRPSIEAWPHVELRTGLHTPDALSLRFLGTSSLALEDGQDLILIDGYFSRPGLWALLTHTLIPDQERISFALKQGRIERISALLVAHTHFDHALDAVPLAFRFGARLLGSQTLADISRASPQSPPVEILKTGQGFDVGAFKITAFSTPHSPGDVARGATGQAFRYPAKAGTYPMGEAYSFLIERNQCRILIIPSAGQVGASLANVRADVIFLGIGQLASQGDEGTAAYWRDTVEVSQATVVIPIHWDDFTRPLDQPLRPLPYVADRFNLTMKRLTALAERSQVVLALPPLFEAMDLSQLPAGACG